LCGWFNILFPLLDDDKREEDERRQYPKQFRNYEMAKVSSYTKEVAPPKLRLLLKLSQLDGTIVLRIYNESKRRSSAESFDDNVDGNGAMIVLATTKDKNAVGGYI